jgi:peptide/nickel transport system permease protein
MPRRMRPWVVLLIVCHSVVFLAGFLSPYDVETQNRLLAFAPPSRIHVLDAQGKPGWPFVFNWEPVPGTYTEYREDRSVRYPIRFFIRGAPYRFCGIWNFHTHLFGTEGRGKIFLLGTDVYGRDQFSRLLYGGRISLSAGLLAAALALSLGVLLGALAGYCGRALDELIMRIAEVFLAVPWFYLLLAARAFLPLHLDSQAVLFLLIALLGGVGWARPARLVRGVVLRAKESDYVFAARGFGASNFYLLRVHILPQVYGLAGTQAALLVPRLIVAEVTLSYLGLGISEPQASWGNMLAGVQNYFVIQFCWWLFAPAIALIFVLFVYGQLVSSSLFSRSEV